MHKFDVYLKTLLEKCQNKKGEGEVGGVGSSDEGMYDSLKVFLDVGQWAADFRRLHQSWNRKLERDQMKEQLHGLSALTLTLTVPLTLTLALTVTPKPNPNPCPNPPPTLNPKPWP
jgi:hypothetical protein